MSAIVVDTSAWVPFFAGETISVLEEALQDARAILSPIVLSEILSGVSSPKDQARLLDFLNMLPLHPTDRDHWINVGGLRRTLQKQGLSVSTPDAHVAQCAIEGTATLLSRDKVFEKIARHTPLKLSH